MEHRERILSLVGLIMMMMEVDQGCQPTVVELPQN